ncbi:MAG TPA: chemotaxis protein CheW [Vicinamibacterales bacterium]
MGAEQAVVVTAPADVRDTAGLAGKYLTFTLAGEDYAVGVLKVREIIKLLDITSVPQVPRHVKGVVNLRGKVIPVVDLRLKFGFEEQAYTDRTCIVVVEVAMPSSTALMGIVVDSVSDVLTLSAADLEAPPEFGARASADYILGVATVKGRVKILLDLDRVLGADAALTPGA